MPASEKYRAPVPLGIMALLFAFSHNIATALLQQMFRRTVGKVAASACVLSALLHYRRDNLIRPPPPPPNAKFKLHNTAGD